MAKHKGRDHREETEDLRPSERLKRLHDKQRDENAKVSAEEEAALLEKAKPHIEILQKYISEPDEIEAYLTLYKDAEGLSIAVQEVWQRELLMAQFQAYADEQLRNDQNYLAALNSIGSNEPPERTPDVDLFDKTNNPKLFLSLAILANCLRRRRQRFADLFKPLDSIEYELVINEETGKGEFVPIKGTEDLDSTATNNNLFSWRRVEKFLPALPDNAARRNYLINIRARFEKMPEVARQAMNPDGNFSRNCGIEIERLEKLELLKPPKAETTKTNLDEKLETALTKRQWLIAMSFFMDAFNLRSIEKINLSRLLTVMNNGKNFQDFRAKLGARVLITARTATDAQHVADLFREFGLPQVAADIEAAINKNQG